jgi:hypothetical protein
MYIKEYLTRPGKKKAKDKRMQNKKLLKIVGRNISRTYNEYRKHLKDYSKKRNIKD